MPRWPDGATSIRRICKHCGGKKDFYAEMCRCCRVSRNECHKPLQGITGPNHPTWKGGRRKDREGYLQTYAPLHPWPRRGGYVREHVRIVEIHIGRRIKPNENVHHVDGDRGNNALGNLQLLTKSEHSRLHRHQDTHLRQRDSRGRFA